MLAASCLAMGMQLLTLLMCLQVGWLDIKDVIKAFLACKCAQPVRESYLVPPAPTLLLRLLRPCFSGQCMTQPAAVHEHARLCCKYTRPRSC